MAVTVQANYFQNLKQHRRGYGVWQEFAGAVPFNEVTRARLRLDKKAGFVLTSKTVDQRHMHKFIHVVLQ